MYFFSLGKSIVISNMFLDSIIPTSDVVCFVWKTCLGIFN